MVSFTLLALATAITAATAQNTTLRYMPFGDSITEIICWRSKLWQKLQTTEWAVPAVDFVGSGKTENNCKDTKYDRDNEGHSGFLAIDIVNKKQLDGWLKTNPADVISMHLGTNDIVQQGKAVADIIKAFTTLVATMRTSNPKMKIVVAQIIPIGIGSYNTKIQELNKAIIPWAQGLNSTASPIWVVDQYTGFSSTADLRDGVHPNDSGDVKMLNVWYPALIKAFAEAKKEKTGATKREVKFLA
ncbi:carbohydrate esterase family 3 protein [Amniculicola lignicola CBS 123094]|uniref:Carbohydrate esterase family 3 protein n=1 Tax=Amniculicola lignicola CBS 123094 TaxID=1392246 RepID=A0A6A5W404_9PLEO|nr:carbohydrate esterase family 3 protein [Amniculicola lignicola CBS 123094]